MKLEQENARIQMDSEQLAKEETLLETEEIR